MTRQKLKTNQKGFAHIWLLLLFVFIIIGLVGFYVLNANKYKDDASDTASSQSASQSDKDAMIGETVEVTISPVIIPTEKLVIPFDESKWDYGGTYKYSGDDYPGCNFTESGILRKGMYSLDFSIPSCRISSEECPDKEVFDPENCYKEIKNLGNLTLNGKNLNIYAIRYYEATPDNPITDYSLTLTHYSIEECKRVSLCPFPSRTTEHPSFVTGQFAKRSFADLNEFIATPEVQESVSVLKNLSY